MTPNLILSQFAAGLGEEEDSTTATVGNSLYVRYGNDLLILKITCAFGEALGEMEVSFELIHPECGPIDTVSFVLTRSGGFTPALEQLAAYRAIWF
ncbi:hypothetical protein [Streptomyces sp. NPDC086782]|uniref:hypothetical protein n=1 Tax=Streptomyces sp. NPDC086782 TaxID=3365757 RepID=UPI0037F5B4E0